MAYFIFQITMLPKPPSLSPPVPPDLEEVCEHICQQCGRSIDLPPEEVRRHLDIELDTNCPGELVPTGRRPRLRERGY